MASVYSRSASSISPTCHASGREHNREGLAGVHVQGAGAWAGKESIVFELDLELVVSLLLMESCLLHRVVGGARSPSSAHGVLALLPCGTTMPGQVNQPPPHHTHHLVKRSTPGQDPEEGGGKGTRRRSTSCPGRKLERSVGCRTLLALLLALLAEGSGPRGLLGQALATRNRRESRGGLVKGLSPPCRVVRCRSRENILIRRLILKGQVTISNLDRPLKVDHLGLLPNR